MDHHRVGPDTRNTPTRELAALRFERGYDEEVAISLSALDCVLLGRKGIYASSELTSGRRAQRLQREHNVPNVTALRDALGAEDYDALLWSPNVEAAVAFANRLRGQLGDAELVISPAPFAAPDWPQEAYLKFWESVIRTRVKSVYFNEGWEYSTGCVFEFAVAAEAGLPTLDSATRPLSGDQTIERVSRAIHEMEASGLDTRAIKSSLDRLTR
jgi:hypothetical protein